MNSSKDSSTNTTAGYIFVKIRRKKMKLSSAKRVLIPAKLEILRKSIQTIFKMKDPIKSLYTIEGEFIHEITQIDPGITIIASKEEPKGKDAEIENELNNQRKYVRQFDPSAKLLYTEFPTQSNNKNKVNAAPKCLIVGFPEALTVDQANLKLRIKKREQGSPTSHQKSGKGSAMSSVKKRSGSPLFQKAQDDQNANVVPSSNFHFFDQTSYTFESASDMSVSTTTIQPQKFEFEKKVIKKTRADTVKSLLSSVLNIPGFGDLKDSKNSPDAIFIKNVNSAISKMKPEQKEFVTSAETNEFKQKQYWMKMITDLLSRAHFCEKTTGLFLNSEIHEYVRKSVLKHRFIAGNSAFHRFKIGIVGPPKSGKSTLLHIYLQELLLEIVASDEWKSTFVFPMKIDDVESTVNNYESFYHKIINLILDEIVQQKPIYQKWIFNIRKYFESVTSHLVPLILSKSCYINKYVLNIQNKLIEIGRVLHEAWTAPSGFEWWYTLIFLLPSLISNVLGFRKTIYVIDNIEEYDILLEPHHPFDNTSQFVFISEHLKHALSRNDYIFACHNMGKLYSMLNPIDDEGIDLKPITDFISTNGISSDMVENDPPLLMTLSTEDLPFVMKGCDCDGVPNYILLWKDLNQLIDEMDGMNEDTDEFDDVHYFAVAHAQAMINNLFYDENIDYTDEEETNWPHVLSIRRSTKKEQKEFLNEEKGNAIAIQESLRDLDEYEEEEEEEEEEIMDGY